jgi:transcriptional regulator of acetoin/glycerol metabolism
MWENDSDLRSDQDPVQEELVRLTRSRGLDEAHPLPSVVEESWKRCLADHQLLPDRVPRAAVLSHSEMRDLSETYGDLLSVAGPEVEKLFLRLVDSDYLVSLASPQGVMMLFRCDYQFLGDMSSFGVLPGSVWTEERQGTNGVGTCLRVGKSITIMGNHHYGAATQSLTCLTSPVLGRFGAVESVLNVTTPRTGDERTNRVVLDIVERAARRIENRYFGQTHRNKNILRLSRDRDCVDLAEEGWLALNDDGIVVAATSLASKLTGRALETLVGMPAADALELRGTFGNARPDLPVRLNVNGREIYLASSVAEMQPETRRSRTPISLTSRESCALESTPVAVRSDVRPEEIRLEPMESMVLDRAQKLLEAGLPLVVEGESGTGKTLFAQIATRRSFGEESVIVMVDCAAPSGLAIAAAAARSIETIARGAVILDRIDELDENGQAALLMVLEKDRLFANRRTGLISVTSTNLDQRASEGRLRRDLLHRLKGGTIELDPLRSAPDLSGTILGFLDLEASLAENATGGLSDEARLVLANYHWPGNIRELRQALRHALALAGGKAIRLDHLPVDIVSEIARKDLTARSQAEASRIEAALRYNGGNVSMTARHLGVSRATLYRKIQIQKTRESA